MSNPHLLRNSLSKMLLAAVGSVSLALVGCSDESADRGVSHPMRSETNAVQASDSSRVPATPDATVAMAFPTGNRSTSDVLVEETGPREAHVGQTYRYQIRVTNLRSTRLTGIVLEQRIPASIQMSAASPDNAAQHAANAEGRPVAAGASRMEIGDLEPNQAKTVEMAATPLQQGRIDTCLSVHYNAPMLCTMVNVVTPALAIVAEGPSQADLCQDVVYHYTVTNSGSGTAHNVIVQETLPQGLQTADGQQNVAANVGDIAAGQSKSVTAHLKALQPGTFTTQAQVKSDDAGQVTAEKVATAVLAPRLAVTVAGPKEDFLGEPMTYRVTVKNTGDAPAANAKVRLGATPGSVEFVSAQNAEGAKISQEYPGTGQDLGTLAPGESRTVAITFKGQKEGQLDLNATAEAKCAQPVTTPVNTVIRTITASALVVTHDPDPVRIGNDVVYHVTVQNKGSAIDHNVKVSVTLPASEQFVKGSGTTNATADGQNITFAPVGELAPKQSVSWDIEAKALRVDEAQIKVTMTSEATRTPAIKIEPTKLYDENANHQERTVEAPKPTPVAPPVPANK